jgi:hypothetical protein
MVYAKRPFAGPQAVLAYLARYTHRVAISNRRLLAMDAAGIAFRHKDHRREGADCRSSFRASAGPFVASASGRRWRGRGATLSLSTRHAKRLESAAFCPPRRDNTRYRA